MSQLILLGFILHYITLTNYYILKDVLSITFNTLRIYITLYHTYPLLYYKGPIQMEEENNRVRKCQCYNQYS